MIVKRIRAKFFRNLIKIDESFNSLTFIKGKNGSGKSTLSVKALLFCLHGYSDTPLSDLPTRDKAKSCEVCIEFNHNNKRYEITRNYPTKLKIKKESEELKFANSREAQQFINETFGDLSHWKKFRMIDAYNKETNFLEEGQTTLKKIIFSIFDNIINSMRMKLNSIKHEREIYNRDTAVIFPYYPSEKRLTILNNRLNELNKQEAEIETTIRDFERERNTTERKMGQLEQKEKTLQIQKEKTTKDKVCYACKQIVTDKLQKSLIANLENQVTELKQILEKETPELDNIKEVITVYDTTHNKILVHIASLSELQTKLKARIKQKDFRYTTKDIEIAKRAIKELDKLSTYYLTESVKTLEPIINNVLAKINFNVTFDINEKGKFNIILEKNGIKYKQKDLSTGEKLILQVAFKLALLMERNESGIMIADEGLGSLDSENLLHIIQIFDSLPFQLIIVLHRFDDCPENIKIINLDKEESNEKI